MPYEPDLNDLLMATFAITLVAISLTRAIRRRFKENRQ